MTLRKQIAFPETAVAPHRPSPRALGMGCCHGSWGRAGEGQGLLRPPLGPGSRGHLPAEPLAPCCLLLPNVLRPVSPAEGSLAWCLPPGVGVLPYPREGVGSAQYTVASVSISRRCCRPQRVPCFAHSLPAAGGLFPDLCRILPLISVALWVHRATTRLTTSTVSVPGLLLAAMKCPLTQHVLLTPSACPSPGSVHGSRTQSPPALRARVLEGDGPGAGRVPGWTEALWVGKWEKPLSR